MFMVLKTMYKEETLNVSELLSSSNPYKAGGPSSLLYTFVPTSQPHYESTLILGNFSFSGVNARVSSFVADFASIAAPYLATCTLVIKSLAESWVALCSSLFSLLSLITSPSSLVERSISSSVLSISPSTSPLLREVEGLIRSLYVKFSLGQVSTLEAPMGVKSASSSYKTSELSSASMVSSTKHALYESTSDQRFMRNMNAVFKYDFKVGNYMPDDAKKMNPHLFNTIKDVTTGIRKSS